MVEQVALLAEPEGQGRGVEVDAGERQIGEAVVDVDVLVAEHDEDGGAEVDDDGRRDEALARWGGHFVVLVVESSQV